jgi:two-component system OmpR family response regulator
MPQPAAYFGAFEGSAHARTTTIFSVLVVDDEPGILTALAMLLSGEGYVVRTAADGSAALAEVRRAPVDLIISDITMPVLNGRAMIERLRQNGDATPVILMSAADRVQPISGIHFVAKPFDVDHLLTLVEQILANGHAGR